MKQIITLCLLIASLGAATSAQAQEKEDLLNLFEVLFDLDDVQDLFQHEMPQGPTLLIRRPNSRSMGTENPEERIGNILYELQEEELDFLNQPVRLLTEREAQNLNIAPRLLTNMSLRMTDTEAIVMLNGYLWESLEMYSGQFSFTRYSVDDDWEVNSSNFDKQRSR